MRDPAKAKERARRYRAKKHAERYGEGSGSQRGRHGNHARGKNHPRWTEARIVSSEGYIKVRVGQDHPLADPNGYAYEHLMVWATSGRSLPTTDEILHHRNEDKADNRLSNLVVLSRSEHGRLHIADRERDAAGRLLEGRTWDETPQVAEALRLQEMPA